MMTNERIININIAPPIDAANIKSASVRLLGISEGVHFSIAEGRPFVVDVGIVVDDDGDGDCGIVDDVDGGIVVDDDDGDGDGGIVDDDDGGIVVDDDVVVDDGDAGGGGGESRHRFTDCWLNSEHIGS